MKDIVQEAAETIAASGKIVALTGAGVSVDSGIPDFRSSDGLWSKYDPMEYGTIQAFHANPVKIWEMLRELSDMVLDASPNPGHTGLAELESMGKLSSIVTQNIDGLHQAAGNSTVIEFHGNSRKLVCLNCKRKYDRKDIVLDSFPPMCACLNVLKPNVVFFGEMIPIDALLLAQSEAESCDVMLVIGTSAQVVPAADLPPIAKSRGARIIEINPEHTPLTGNVADVSIHERAATAVPALAKAVKQLVQK